MRRFRSLERRGALATLLLGLWLAGRPAWAQQGAPQGAPPAAKEQPPDDSQKKDENPWLKVPPLRPIPRPGAFVIFPSGEGYYSLSDVLHGKFRDKPPVYPYTQVSICPFPFFDANFNYLDKPDNTQTDLFDCLHRIHLGDNWMFSTGGEFRDRYMNEVDARLTGKNNTYDLIRTRVYGDLWYQNCFRIYVEFLDAHTSPQSLVPLPIDQDRADMLNFFVDVRVCEIDGHPVYLRGGRQELLQGSQRLISPLDWANTQRTFEGVRGMYLGENFDVDLFWVQPVIPDPGHFDSVDHRVNFSGLWTTYRPKKGTTFDLYLLDLDNYNAIAPGTDLRKRSFNVATVGYRYAGDVDNRLLFDFEGMYQFGNWSDQAISAGAYTTSLGYHFADVPMDPQFWVAYDFASGDHNSGTRGAHGTFNQLFPFGHYYFGYLDLVGRQNIMDPNAQFVVFPTPWIFAGIQYHHFMLDSSRDALYAANGVAIRRDPTGKASNTVGDEIDLYTNFHLSAHSDVLVGYSKLFAGNFIRATGSPLSPELFYVQYSFRW
jgi:hypothetical protein